MSEATSSPARRPSTSLRFAAGPVLAGLALAACGSPAGPAPAATSAATGTPVSVAAEATVVRRAPRTATPTPIDPLAPVASKVIPGVVVPAAAVLVGSAAATTDADARADYRIEDVDAAALDAWFKRELPEAGWGKPEERDGALVFVHDSDLSARFASLGQKRSATVLFDLTDEADFTLIVEAPEP